MPQQNNDPPKECRTAGDILRWYITEYNLDTWTPGIFVRIAIIEGMNAALKNFKRNA